MMTNSAKIILIKQLCISIVKTKNPEDILTLGNLIKEKEICPFLQVLQRDVLATIYSILKNEADNKTKLKEDHEIVVINILNHLLSYTKLSNHVVFFNLFGFLLQQIYDSDSHQIKNISEDFKIVILSCVKSLLNSTDSELTINLYSKENGKKMCKMIYVVVEIANSEKFKNLRIEALECLMALFKVYSDDDYCDILYRSLVAECFSYFLPGVSMCLKNVALGNDHTGFKLIKTSIKAIGRILSLLMQDYKSDNSTLNSLEQAKIVALNCLSEHKNVNDTPCENNKLEDFMEGLRDLKWFKKSDQQLSKIFIGFRKLTQHQMSDIRYELGEMCVLFIQNCSKTMPQSLRYFVEILIILSEDEDSEISQRMKKELKTCTEIVLINQNIFFANALQTGFSETFSEIPNVFNGIDEKDKKAILKLTAGYVELFGSKLHLHKCFKEFMLVLIHLCSFKIDISTFEENIILDMENHDESQTLGVLKNLEYLTDENLRKSFGDLCDTLVKNELFEVLVDFLITTYQNGDQKKEATYLLNLFVSGLKHEKSCDKIELIKPIFNMYIDSNNWDLPISKKDFESLRTIRSNIQQIALHVIGLGIMAEVLEKEYQIFLLQSLFLILTRAGSEQPLVAEAGKKALRKVAIALNYKDSVALINSNMDYFVFYIERNLRSACSKENAFNVLEVVIVYGDKTTFNNLMSIIEEVLVQSCDRYKQKNIDSYLRIFKIFVKNLLRWFEVVVPPNVLKTKEQKQKEELEKFQINGLKPNTQEIEDFSDDIMGKTAEELYKEDMERKQEELEKEYTEPEVEEYKKPKPPDHVKLTVEILKRTLNFLPSKEKERQLLVLEILRDGVEIIKDYEDELLPITHLIWSPLVGRFKNIKEPVIINYSFRLLCTLGRVSKDFIRNRTAKDVLPSVVEVLEKLSKESYKKDRGSAYRYTQSYKLQTVFLEELGYLVTNIDLLEKDLKKIMDVVFVYLNNKQPLPLQVEAVKFFDQIILYDPDYQEKISSWYSTHAENNDFRKNVEKIIKKQ